MTGGTFPNHLGFEALYSHWENEGDLLNESVNAAPATPGLLKKTVVIKMTENATEHMCVLSVRP